MSDHDLPSILASGQRQAEQLAVTVTTPDGQQVEGDISLTKGGASWWVRAWASVTAKRGAKTQSRAGIEIVKRFFSGG